MNVSEFLRSPGDAAAAMLGPSRKRQLPEKLADARRTLTEALTRGLCAVCRRADRRPTRDEPTHRRGLSQARPARRGGVRLPSGATLSSAPSSRSPTCGWWPISPIGIATGGLPTRTSSRRGSAACSRRLTVSTCGTRRSYRLTQRGGSARVSSPPWPPGPIRSASRPAIFASSASTRKLTK